MTSAADALSIRPCNFTLLTGKAGLAPISLFTAAIILMFPACGGGGGQQMPPPKPDFNLVVSPISASAVIGNTTSPVTVSIMPQNGFSGSVDITLSGLPSGVTATPGSSFAIQAGASQAVSFAVSNTASTGVFQLTASGSDGTSLHTAQILLTTEPVVSTLTYQ